LSSIISIQTPEKPTGKDASFIYIYLIIRPYQQGGFIDQVNFKNV